MALMVTQHLPSISDPNFFDVDDRFLNKMGYSDENHNKTQINNVISKQRLTDRFIF